MARDAVGQFQARKRIARFQTDEPRHPQLQRSLVVIRKMSFGQFVKQQPVLQL